MSENLHTLQEFAGTFNAADAGGHTLRTIHLGSSKDSQLLSSTWFCPAVEKAELGEAREVEGCLSSFFPSSLFGADQSTSRP